MTDAPLLKHRATELLHSLYGPDASFRDGQWEAIHDLVEGRRRVLVVQRTGWGKSLVADGIHESAAPDTSVPVRSHDDGATDAYGLVIRSIVEYCAAPRTPEDVTAAFALERAQAKAWLARAVEEGRLRKRARPVRYEATGTRDLFGTAN